MQPVFITWFLQNLIWPPTRLALYLFAHFKIYGADNLNELKGGVIFVGNHMSELDPILLPAALPWFSRFSPIFYVSREKTFYNIRQILKRIFYGGFFFEIWGAYPTHVGLNDYEKSLQTHIKILERGHSLFVFPEGDKSFDGKMHEGKGGAIFLACRTGKPIIPIATVGAYHSDPKSFFERKKRITLVFGKPIYPIELFDKLEEISPRDYKIAMNSKVMPVIAKMSNNSIETASENQAEVLISQTSESTVR